MTFYQWSGNLRTKGEQILCFFFFFWEVTLWWRYMQELFFLVEPDRGVVAHNEQLLKKKVVPYLSILLINIANTISGPCYFMH